MHCGQTGHSRRAGVHASLQTTSLRKGDQCTDKSINTSGCGCRGGGGDGISQEACLLPRQLHNAGGGEEERSIQWVSVVNVGGPSVIITDDYTVQICQCQRLPTKNVSISNLSQYPIPTVIGALFVVVSCSIVGFTAQAHSHACIFSSQFVCALIPPLQ